MAIEKWNWNGENHSGLHNDSAYSESGHGSYTEGYDVGPVYFNASAEQVQAAYNAFSGKGCTESVSTKVWNDICDKIICVQREWEIYPTLYNWTTSPYMNMADPDLANGVTGRAVTAFTFNWICDSIVVVGKWPWEKELGRKLKPRDPCKGEYFLYLVDRMNHWIELAPIPFPVSDGYLLNTRCMAREVPSVRVGFSQKISTAQALNIRTDFAPLLTVFGKIKFPAQIQAECSVPSLPFGSQFNFFDFKTTAKARIPNISAISWPGRGFGTVCHAAIASDAAPILGSTATLGTGYQFGADTAQAQKLAQIGGFGSAGILEAGGASAISMAHGGRFGTTPQFVLYIQDDNELPGNEGTFGTVGTASIGGCDAGVMELLGAISGVSGDVTLGIAGSGLALLNGGISVAGELGLETQSTVPLNLDGNVRFGGLLAIGAAGAVAAEGETGLIAAASAESDSSRERDMPDGVTEISILAVPELAGDKACGMAGEAESTADASGFLVALADLQLAGETEQMADAQGEAAMAPSLPVAGETGVAVNAQGQATQTAGRTADGEAALGVAAGGDLSAQHGNSAEGETELSMFAAADAITRHGVAVESETGLMADASGEMTSRRGTSAESETGLMALATGEAATQAGRTADGEAALGVAAGGDLSGNGNRQLMDGTTEIYTTAAGELARMAGLTPMDADADMLLLADGVLSLTKQVYAEAQSGVAAWAEGEADSALTFTLPGAGCAVALTSDGSLDYSPVMEIGGTDAAILAGGEAELTRAAIQWILESEDPDMTEEEAGSMLELDFERRFVFEE